MRRRHYLATTAALLAGPLAGCAHPTAILEMDTVSDAEIAERASRTVTRHPAHRDVVADAVENGTANATGRSPPLEPGLPVEYEGRYYELDVTETDRREATEYGISIDYDPGTATPGGEVVDYAELPAVDRAAMDSLLPPPEDANGGDGTDFGVAHAYSEEEAAASVLVPEQEYDAVRYEGEHYPIRTDDGRTVTVSDYRYRATAVAATAAEYAAWVRESYRFTLSGLSDAEREVVEQAIDGGYHEGSVEDAFASVARRFHDHEPVKGRDGGGNWLVRYEGSEYWADLQHPPGAVEG